MISILCFSIFSISFWFALFLTSKSLEKISIFLFGKIIFNSEYILSTPGPHINISHLLLLLHALDKEDLWPQ